MFTRLTSRRRNLSVGITAFVGAVGLVAAPAFAAVEYGYVRSDSVCASYSSATTCNVWLTYGSRTVLTKPKPTGTVTNCPGIPNGTSIYSALNGNQLDGRYVGVVWSNTGTNAINCH